MRTIIIAEAGVNHNGSLIKAKKLIDKAKICGADFIKFQTFNPDDLVLKKTKKANYQKNKPIDNQSQYDLLNSLALNQSQFFILKKYCIKKKIKFLSSPFDVNSLNFLNKLGVEAIKIPSGEITNLTFLEKVGRLKKKTFLSTGMANLNEIETALKILKKNGLNNNLITLFQCNTAYPTPFADANLGVIDLFKKKFSINVGYSDHTLGIEASIAAVSLGASVIEKHFTLSNNDKGPDHKASLNPEDFKKMVNAIRNIELSMGSQKKLTNSEKKNIHFVRKSIVTTREIKRGEKFTTRNIAIKRPGNGISPMLWYKYLNKTSKKKYKANQLIKK